MINRRLPPTVRSLLRECIQSVSELEILATLFRTFPMLWDEEKMSQELRSHPSSIKRQMERLSECNLLEQFDGSFGIKESAMDNIKELMEIYQNKPVAVISFIYEKPDEIQSFADAFKLKKD